jgi:hypothetical protein
VAANTLNSFRNGASLLANSFRGGFIGWLGIRALLLWVPVVAWLGVWSIKSPYMIAPSTSMDEINAVTRKQDCAERICADEEDDRYGDEHRIRHR